MMFRLSSVFKTLSILAVIMLLASCATIVGQSGPETLNVRSAPDQATVVISDESGNKIFEGKTPTLVSLEKKKGYFSGKKYSVTISKQGYSSHMSTVDTRVNGWYIGGNLLLGGLIGWLIVDPATGAMWTLDRTEINATLQPSQGAEVLQPDKAIIVLLQDVPLSLRMKMVPVSQ